MPHCRNAVRGTFRHAGFASVMKGCVRLGFFSQEEVDPNTTWVEYISRSCEADEMNISQRILATFENSGDHAVGAFTPEDA